MSDALKKVGDALEKANAGDGLRFGAYSGELGPPEDGRALWGARWIWPDDQLYDRQDCVGPDEGRARLLEWLNDGAGQAARAGARRICTRNGYAGELLNSENRQVVLYEDERGVVIGNPQGSYGYLYVAAWLR